TEDLKRVQKITWRALVRPHTTYAYGDIHLPSGKKTSMLMRRWIMDPPQHLDVDHINNNGLDNRKDNLRFTTRSENLQNRVGAQRNNKTSGIRGVYWEPSRQKWLVQVTVNRKTVTIGRFKTIEEA